ncbi:hypothetical protein E2C01_092201 [Portunus trituberculatus]|uniref:Uncharacterized protein n=1 Tax=Portunus trituberculatus TaxID=210409 RepID=A0A5B7JJH4_PORTR|nr:hypothetical protein [Portunus trituberculatus]
MVSQLPVRFCFLPSKFQRRGRRHCEAPRCGWHRGATGKHRAPKSSSVALLPSRIGFKSAAKLRLIPTNLRDFLSKGWLLFKDSTSSKGLHFPSELTSFNFRTLMSRGKDQRHI